MAKAYVTQPTIVNLSQVLNEIMASDKVYTFMDIKYMLDNIKKFLPKYEKIEYTHADLLDSIEKLYNKTADTGRLTLMINRKPGEMEGDEYYELGVVIRRPQL